MVLIAAADETGHISGKDLSNQNSFRTLRALLLMVAADVPCWRRIQVF